MLKYFNDFLFNNYSNDNIDESQEILSNLNTTPSNTMFNPIEKKLYFLEDLDLYHFKSDYNSSITVKFLKDNIVIDTINIKGKYYEKDNENYSYYIFNYLPKFNAGKIKIEMNIFNNTKLVDNDWFSLNYIIHGISKEKNRNIIFNTNNHKILLKLDIKNNEYIFKEIFIFKLIK